MKTQGLKTFLMLCAPAIALLGFGLMRPGPPALRVQSVRVRPTIITDGISRAPGNTTVEVLLAYNDPSLLSRWTEQHWPVIDAQHGVYVQDEAGHKYGFSSTASDRKTWRNTEIGYYHVDDPMNTLWLLELGNIPGSAGRLTFKAVLNIDSPYASKALARLPLAIVVRE